MDKARHMWDDALELWRGWPPIRRAVAVGSLAVGCVAFLAILAWATHQNFVPLMSNLSQEDAHEIVARLEADNVPYRLAAGGTAILVPDDQVHQLRLKVAGEGLPKGGNVGFEMFDNPTFGMSHFAEQLNYHRALEGELRRTIRQIDSVRDARVHIVMPERSFFRDAEQMATASITVQMQPGRKLSPQQTQAVVHLISSSVQGLNPQQVTVVDEAGTILAKGGQGAHDLDSGLEKQRAIERSLEERVKELLLPVVGAGHAVVKVSALLDFSHNERTHEKYDPAERIVRSEQFSEEKHSTGDREARGIPGSRTNLAGVKDTPATGGGSDRRLETRNYEVSKLVEREIGQMGRLARLNVAVLVDGVMVAGADGTKTLTERPPAELDRIAELVRRTVGFDADRDDQIVVQSMAFATPMEEPAVAEVAPALAYAERMWRPALLTTVALVLLGVMITRSRDASAPIAQVLEMPRTVRELEARLSQTSEMLRLKEASPAALAGAAAGSEASPVGLASAAEAAAAGAAGSDGPLQLTEGKKSVTRSLHSFKRPEPARAANVLKIWLNEA